MIKKFSLAAAAALICVILSTAALASQTGQNTVYVEEPAGNGGQKIVTVMSSGENDEGQKIVTVTPSGDDGEGQKIVTVTPSGENDEGQKIVTVGTRPEGHNGRQGQKIVTVSGGDTYSVKGDANSPRLSYEEYSFWGFSDGYDDGYDYYGDGYYDGYQPVSPDSGVIASVSGSSVSGSQAVGYFDDYNDSYGGYGGGYYDDGYYDYGYYDDGHVAERGGGVSGMLILISLGIGAIVALTYYFSTKSSYENAGIGVVYDLKENAVLKLGNTRDASSGVIDRQIDTRSHIDRGYYGRSSAQISSGQTGYGGSLSAPYQGNRPNVQGGMHPNMQGGMRPPQGRPPQGPPKR